MNLDKLNGAVPEEVGQAALRALAGMAQMTPEQQVLGLGLAFIAAAKVNGVRGAKVLEVAGNILRKAEYESGAVQGIRMYMEGEVR